jgi:5,10-methylenetetrahydromethanopterin reductase
MELSCGLPPGAETGALARLAETLGYRRVWLYDSAALYADVWVTLADVARATSRVGLGSAVLVPSFRHVLATASAIATLEGIAPGRLAVAIGTGFTGRYALGQKPLPWRAVERYVAELRALLRGETVRVDGSAVRMLHPPGFAPRRPIATPIVVAANGPKGLEVARKHGDGVMCIGGPQPGFSWCAVFGFGTVLDEGETAASPRAFEALAPALAVIYHGSYEGAPARVDALPGGRAWREEIEGLPAAERHLAVHEDHLVRATERDRRHLSPALAAATWTGTRAELRARFTELAQRGATELVYAPHGPDLGRELRAMAEAAEIPSARRA